MDSGCKDAECYLGFYIKLSESYLCNLVGGRIPIAVTCWEGNFILVKCLFAGREFGW